MPFNEYCVGVEARDESEKRWIQFFRAEWGDEIVNCQSGGGSKFSVSGETREKQRRLATGRKQSKETIAKRVGRKHTKSELEKMSLSQKGKPKSLEHVLKIRAARRIGPDPKNCKYKDLFPDGRPLGRSIR